MNQVILFAFRNKLINFESKCRFRNKLPNFENKCRFRNKLLADETQYCNATRVKITNTRNGLKFVGKLDIITSRNSC